MRQRQNYSGKFSVVDSILGPETRSEPLDENEQEAVIREFEALSQQQHIKWRLVIGGGTLAAGIFFLYAAWRQYVDPFGVRYTGELRTAIPGDAATSVLLVQALSLLISAGGLLNSHLPPPGQREASCLPFVTRHLVALWLGVGGASLGAVCWTAVLIRMVQLHSRQHGAHWELFWLPAGPLAACLLCCHVAHILTDTEREIQQLRGYRYRFKKL
ncbi:hypothetical protein Vretimale_1882 [Volvox reticuliferus]|uniref:Uncharacterized protein n=1 Tax=Volvox reticuliferus TaxID=1737510 RepID=A0A8J4D8R0_9CHLO|nr:hypothetical protein Vretifemale_17381 [Volvox reticuliferus]GIL95963.1 hypothetical protein Vretimale_1882 [Volvox reticuliferus]